MIPTTQDEKVPFPLQIQFKEMAYSDAAHNLIVDHALKLHHVFNRIISCHVTVSLPHRSQRKGKIFHVQVRLFIPGNTIIVNCEPEKNDDHADIRIAIHDVFSSALRQLEDHINVRRDLEKVPVVETHAIVSKLFTYDGYGFITTPDGREIYFHQNSVVNGFPNIKIGDEVRFSEVMGEKGPQVTSMTAVGKNGHHLVPKMDLY